MLPTIFMYSEKPSALGFDAFAPWVLLTVLPSLVRTGNAMPHAKTLFRTAPSSRTTRQLESTSNYVPGDC